MHLMLPARPELFSLATHNVIGTGFAAWWCKQTLEIFAKICYNTLIIDIDHAPRAITPAHRRSMTARLLCDGRQLGTSCDAKNENTPQNLVTLVTEPPKWSVSKDGLLPPLPQRGRVGVGVLSPDKG